MQRQRLAAVLSPAELVVVGGASSTVDLVNGFYEEVAIDMKDFVEAPQPRLLRRARDMVEEIRQCPHECNCGSEST